MEGRGAVSAGSQSPGCQRSGDIPSARALAAAAIVRQLFPMTKPRTRSSPAEPGEANPVVSPSKGSPKKPHAREIRTEPGKVTNPVAGPSKGPSNVQRDHVPSGQAPHSVSLLMERARARRSGEVAVASVPTAAAVSVVPPGGAVTVVNPAGTVGVDVLLGEPLATERLELEWARWPRAGVSAAEFRALPRRDAAAARAVMAAGTDEWSAQAWRRFTSGHGQRMFQIPATLRTDRTWLLDPSDAPYVEAMEDFLFEGVDREPPVLQTSAYTVPAQIAIEARERQKAALSVSVIYGRVMTYDDYAVVRTATSHRSKVSHAHTMREYPHPLGTSATLPRVSYYFGGEVAGASDAVRARYVLACELEHVVGLTGGLDYERRITKRAWIVPDATLAFIRDYLDLPPIPFTGGSQKVSVASVVAELELTARTPLASRTQREDWATGGLQVFLMYRDDGTLVMPRRRGPGSRRRNAIGAQGVGGKGGGSQPSGYRSMQDPPTADDQLVCDPVPSSGQLGPGAPTGGQALRPLLRSQPAPSVVGGGARGSQPLSRAPEVQVPRLPVVAPLPVMATSLVPDGMARSLMPFIMGARVPYRANGWPLQELAALMRERIETLEGAALGVRERMAEMRREVEDAQADLARERAIVDRWVGGGQMGPSTRRDEYRNSSRWYSGARGYDDAYDREEDDGYERGDRDGYGQKRVRREDY